MGPANLDFLPNDYNHVIGGPYLGVRSPLIDRFSENY